MNDTADFLTFDAFLNYWAHHRPDTVALAQGERVITYRQLEYNSRRIAAVLAQEGVGKGDRIAWLGKNSDLFFQLFYAAARIGVVMTPIGWRLAPPEVRYILSDCGAKLLFAGDDFVDAAERTGEQAGAVVIAEAAMQERIARSEPAAIVPAGAEDAALQVYTSGTTGNPKGAVLAARSLFGLHGPAIRAGVPWADVSADESFLVCMPCAHVGGTKMALLALANGVTSLIQAEFDPVRVFDAIDEGVTRIFVVPASLHMLIHDSRAAVTDFSRLRSVIYGAAPMPLELLREAARAMPGAGFQQGYGLTETSGSIVVLAPADHDLVEGKRLRSCGRASPGVEVKIAGPDGKELPRGEVGEIWTQSPAQMLEYWNLPDATATSITDGWLRTGDAAYMDEEGYIYLLDRIKELIISGGENVYPAEVESAIFGHPDVAEVAVIGVPDDRWGEAVKACVVAKPGHTVDPASVIAWARERVAAFKAPKSVDVIKAIPRNANGKILHRDLREPYWVGRERRVN